MVKVGRNDDCHCGSGIKYKKCCLPKEETMINNNVIEINHKSPLLPPELSGGMEKEMTKIKNILEAQKFSSVEEMNTFLADNMDEINDGLFDEEFDDEFDQDPLSMAQDLIYEAWEYMYAKDRVEAALEALSISPDCADAYCILAEDKAKKLEDKISFYLLGMEAGLRVLGSAFFRKNKGHFWGIIEARPFMRAKLGFALKIWELGDKEEAISHCWDLLELNVNDNQGVRYLLINFLVETKNNEELTKLFKLFPDDCTAMWLYPKSLALFQTEGNSKRATKALSDAVQSNNFVPAFLLEKKKVPKKKPENYSWKSNEEAILYCVEGMKAWKVTDGALEWLKNNI